MSEVTVEVKGLSELMARLDALPVKLADRIERKSLRRAAKIMTDVAKQKLAQNGSVFSGTLQSSIRVGVMVDRQTGTLKAIVFAGNQPKSFRQKYKVLLKGAIAEQQLQAGGVGDFPNQGDAYYAYFVEFGTGAHFENPLGRAMKIGQTFVAQVNQPGARPKPFMRPAFDVGAPFAIEEFRKDLADGLDEIAGNAG